MVVINLRESARSPDSNSDRLAWGQFAQYLQEAGCFPVLLHDIDTALDPTPPEFDGIQGFPVAVFNLELRVALFELAHICTFVSTGPSTLAFYNKNIRYLYFASGQWLTGNPNPFNRTGTEVGRTPPFANAFQRWHLQGQDTAGLIAAYLELDRFIEENKGAPASGQFGAPLRENREPLGAVAQRIYRWLADASKPYLGVLKLILAYLENLSPEECDDPALMQMAGDTHFQLGHWDQAAAVFLSLVERTGAEDATIGLGKVYEASGRAGEAVRLYEAAMTGANPSVGLRYRLAVASELAGDYDKSITHYRNVIDSGLHVKEVYQQLGDLYEKTGETDLALECYLAAAD